MQLPLTKEDIISKSRQYYKTLINEAKPKPFSLALSLTTNPFLKGRDQFKYLNSKLKEYNSRIEKGEVKDPYEMLSYERTHSMLSDLSQIETSEGQAAALQQIFKWFKEQTRLIQQREDQGQIRYQMNKQYRQAMKHIPIKQQEKTEEELNIPFYLIERIIEPYRRQWRTLHGQYQNPSHRLKEYKVKTLNILNLATSEPNKEDTKPARVLYPMPPKYEEPKEQEPKPEGEGTEGQPAEKTDQPQPPVEGENAQGVTPEEAPDQPGLDFGGPGQQPEEPDDEDGGGQDQPDRLRPKNPIYVDAVKVDITKKYKQGYMFFQGNDTKEQRNMDLRYLKLYHDKIKKQREDMNQIDFAHQWAKRKARVAKDMQRKLEEMKLKPQYSYSNEPSPPDQHIDAQDQLRFGFTTAVRQRPKTLQFDLTLPELSNTARLGLDQKSIRRDRITSLRNKFAKVLNLADHEERQSAPSLCQYTSRKRGISEIIRNHSHSRERLIQLQEVGKIKEKLIKAKVNINIKALSKGLCLPDNQDYFSETAQQFPAKQLPSNPDMAAQSKKKKKKKK